jgi:hypothetical protein
LLTFQALCGICRDKLVDYGIDVTIKEGIERIYGFIDTMVCDSRLREIIGSDFLTSVATANLTFSGGSYLFTLLSLFNIIKLGIKQTESLFFILKLASLLVTLYYYTRGLVCKSYR